VPRRPAPKTDLDLTDMVLSGPSGAYEALQLYRSRALRANTKGEYMSSIEYSSTGAKIMLKNGYDNAGVELTNLFLDVLTEAAMDIEHPIRQLVEDILASFPADKKNLKVDFLKACVKWTTKCGQRELGDPFLHVQLAECLWESHDKTATYHYCVGEAPEQLSAKIFETYGEEKQFQQRERAVTLGICHFLAVENLRDANEFFTSFQKRMKSKSFHERKSNLITFCDYLLQTCKRDATPLFKQLVNTYASDLDFDENVPSLLMGPVGTRMFGITPKPNMMSMLSHMLSA
jgi:hypothetical protein